VGVVGRARPRDSTGADRNRGRASRARYHPTVVAQVPAALEKMFSGRSFPGFGSGESLNAPEHFDSNEPWCSYAPKLMQVGRQRPARLLVGEARASAAARARSPSGEAPQFAAPSAVAARWGDGLWTLADAGPRDLLAR
jgi:hypothetical protein